MCNLVPFLCRHMLLTFCPLLSLFGCLSLSFHSRYFCFRSLMKNYETMLLLWPWVRHPHSRYHSLLPSFWQPSQPSWGWARWTNCGISTIRTWFVWIHYHFIFNFCACFREGWFAVQQRSLIFGETWITEVAPVGCVNTATY